MQKKMQISICRCLVQENARNEVIWDIRIELAPGEAFLLGDRKEDLSLAGQVFYPGEGRNPNYLQAEIGEEDIRIFSGVREVRSEYSQAHKPL